LNNPVPASVYFAERLDCWGKQSHCATITDDSYHPKLSIRYSSWKSNFPRGFSCRTLVLFDPPIDLSSLPGEVLEEASFPPAPMPSLDNWLTTSLQIPLLKLTDDLRHQMTELDAVFVMRLTPFKKSFAYGPLQHALDA
jgi:hypothetical protein